MKRDSSETILVVDDREENRRMAENALRTMSYDVRLAQDAEAGLRVLERERPHLILLDVMMPGMDGITACRHIKADARWSDIPIIFLSAADDKNLIVQALETGGVDYVTKPFNIAELLSRVRTQLALKRATDQMRMLAEDKDEILGILAHDIKNTLAGVRMSACLLGRRVEQMPADCEQMVDNILGGTDRMLGFVSEFLANQRAEHLQLSVQPVMLGDLLAELIATYRPTAEAKQITLSMELASAPICVLADRTGLRQAIENLMSNAIKFTPLGGGVDVEVESPRAGLVKCVIRDTGPGFTQDDRARMFRRYGRLSAQPTGGESSTGLGLSIVERLLAGMGGKVTLSERAGPGAEFVITLQEAPPSP